MIFNFAEDDVFFIGFTLGLFLGIVWFFR